MEKVLLCCLVLLAQTMCATAAFAFTFDLYSFATSGNCFGDDLTGACETYLHSFCLRGPRESTITDTNDCPLGRSDRTDGGGITRTINSMQPWPGSFQMFIRARDEDNPGTDDNLDAIFINLNLAPFAGYTPAMDYVGRSNRVTVNMRFKVDCSTNYFGDDCSTFCMAMDSNVIGHYLCNGDGSIRCITGFEHPENNCLDRITSCSANPCVNGGTCSPVGLDSHTCACVDGYTGHNCQTEANECFDSPCRNGANCTDLLADYSCECVVGFEDKNCSTNTDDCVDVECAGNSTCLDLINRFECVCNAGFVGANCTQLSTKTATAHAVIAGASVASVVILMLLPGIVVLLLCFASKKRASKLSSLPTTLASGSTLEREDHIYCNIEAMDKNGRRPPTTNDLELVVDNPLYGEETTHDAESMADNPLYGEETTPNTNDAESMADNPLYGEETTSLAAITGTTPQLADDVLDTLHNVNNPLYDNRVLQTGTPIYSELEPTKLDLVGADIPEVTYGYATVDDNTNSKE